MLLANRDQPRTCFLLMVIGTQCRLRDFSGMAHIAKINSGRYAWEMSYRGFTVFPTMLLSSGAASAQQSVTPAKDQPIPNQTISLRGHGSCRHCEHAEYHARRFYRSLLAVVAHHTKATD